LHVFCHSQELSIPKVVIEVSEEETELQLEIISDISGDDSSGDEAYKSYLDVKKKKRRRRSSISKGRPRRKSSSLSPDGYLNFLVKRDSKLQEANSEIAKLKDEVDKMKQFGYIYKTKDVHEMADSLMVSLSSIAHTEVLSVQK